MMSLESVTNDLRRLTDLWPWYWLSYGEKCYAFACVEAFPLNEGDPFPQPGTELTANMEDARQWIGENGTVMLTGDTIAQVERQNGDTICRFIALAHATIVKPLEEITNV